LDALGPARWLSRAVSPGSAVRIGQQVHIVDRRGRRGSRAPTVACSSAGGDRGHRGRRVGYPPRAPALHPWSARRTTGSPAVRAGSPASAAGTWTPSSPDHARASALAPRCRTDQHFPGTGADGATRGRRSCRRGLAAVTLASGPRRRPRRRRSGCLNTAGPSTPASPGRPGWAADPGRRPPAAWVVDRFMPWSCQPSQPMG
jgi:hypothetical protein